jgi:hypothetical protein
MKLVNATKMAAAYTLGMTPDARESLVVAVKGTFTIPDHPDDQPQLADEQAPLVTADEFTGEPGFSAPRYEMDFAPRKPRCDVLFNGSAYAPGGKPVERVQVTMQVGTLSKTFNVVGNRNYSAGALYIAVSDPEPFTVLPISYDNAFGGVDRSNENPAKHRWYGLNHAGVGFHADTSSKALNDKPLPNTEEIGRPVTKPGGGYRPMAFGPVGRGWEPRYKWAGTYDKKWLDETFPFLPADFDERYYQAAPPDQQTDYLKGGEEVVLTNLTPRSRCAFRLPRLELPIVFFRNGEPERTLGTVDTLILEPDLKRFLVVWRSSLALKRNVFEVQQIVTGRMSRGWYRALATGKTYYASLPEMFQGQRETEDEFEEE